MPIPSDNKQNPPVKNIPEPVPPVRRKYPERKNVPFGYGQRMGSLEQGKTYVYRDLDERLNPGSPVTLTDKLVPYLGTAAKVFRNGSTMTNKEVINAHAGDRSYFDRMVQYKQSLPKAVYDRASIVAADKNTMKAFGERVAPVRVVDDETRALTTGGFWDANKGKITVYRTKNNNEKSLIRENEMVESWYNGNTSEKHFPRYAADSVNGSTFLHEFIHSGQLPKSEKPSVQGGTAPYRVISDPYLESPKFIPMSDGSVQRVYDKKETIPAEPVDKPFWPSPKELLEHGHKGTDYALKQEEVMQALTALNRGQAGLKNAVKKNPAGYLNAGISRDALQDFLNLKEFLFSPEDLDERMSFYRAHPEFAELLGPEDRRAVSMYYELADYCKNYPDIPFYRKVFDLFRNSYMMANRNRFSAGQQLTKQAAIITEPQPHQIRAEERGVLGDLILAHGTGSGKTRTAIAIADRLNRPVTVLTPAPLVENFQKELAKHKKGGPPVEVISLPTAVRRNYQPPEGNTLIIDEAHALRNSGTLRQQYVKRIAQKAGRRILLTGTPAYNNITDWAPLVNIAAGKEIVPEDPAAFRKRYIAERRVKPGFWARLLSNAKPGIVEELQNAAELKKALAPYVDVFYKDVEKPQRTDESIDIPLSAEQESLYHYVEGRLPSMIRYKLRHNIPPSKKEAKELNSFLVGVRQASNTTKGFDLDLDGEALEEQSSKLKEAADRLVKMYRKDPNFRALAYSTFLESGVNPYVEMLKRRGVPVATFTGSLSPEERKKVVDDYNSGRVPVIVGSGSASEGLDLKGTKLIQILEPHFNESRIDQVIGRGIRYKSHADLPPEERKVRVQKYRSVLPNGSNWLSRLFYTPPTSVDTYLSTRAEEKQRMIDQVKALFEQPK